MTDEKLYALLLTDPDRGIGKLTEQYTGLVMSVIRARLSKKAFSEQDIEECAADTFTEFYMGLGSFDTSMGSIKARLGLTASRNAVDRLRRLYRSGITLPLDGEAGEYPDSFSIESELEERELKDKLKQAVLGLEHPDREIVFRKYYLGQSSKEIADALDLSVSNVDTRTHRAVKKLRAIMEKGYEN